MLKTVSSATNAIGALNFKGTWNATTNTPTIVSGVGVKGDYFVVSVAGSTTIDGISNWGVGDWIVYNGNIWQRVEGGADLNGVNLTVTNTTTLSGLTASTALALDASKNVVSVANTGTGDNVLATSPTLVTPALGTPSALVGTNITGTATAFTASNVTTNANLTGAVTSTGNATLLGSFSSANLAGALTDETGTGSAVFATSPTLVTPTLGAATATSINKVALTAPASGSTLTIADGKTLTANASLTLAGTDATTMTFPSTNQTIAGLGVAQTFTANQTVSADLTNTGLHSNQKSGLYQKAVLNTVPIVSRLRTFKGLTYNTATEILKFSIDNGYPNAMLVISFVITQTSAARGLVYGRVAFPIIRNVGTNSAVGSAAYMTGPTVFNDPSLGGGFGTPTLTWNTTIASGGSGATQDVRLQLQFSTTSGAQPSGISLDAELIATYFTGGYAEQITMNIV